MIKICNSCKKEKSIDLFHKHKNREDGHQTICKECTNTTNKNYAIKHRLEIKKANAKRYVKNKKNIRQRQREYFLRTKEATYKYQKEWRANNKDKHTAIRRRYHNNRVKHDPNYRLTHNLRSRVRIALKGICKSAKTMELLGCSVDYLKQYIENQFKEGMTWDNYNLCGWHVDHIKPCARFDLTNPEEQRKCFHYSNLQPLWATANIKKSDYYESTSD